RGGQARAPVAEAGHHAERQRRRRREQQDHRPPEADAAPMSTARTQESFFFRALQPGDREQRARMLEAVTRAVAAKGFARVTVSDVVGLAGVSRRTFYEEFTDKEDCFLAAFAAGGEVVRAEVERAIAEVTDGDWRTFLRVS